MTNRDSSNPLLGRRIVVDPGHGGTEPGAIGPTGLRECEVNLKVCFKLVELLREKGAIPILTRTGDVNVSIGERPALCKKENAELFVSIHHNANAQNDRSVNRSEVYYQWKERNAPSADFAREILQELERTFHLPSSRTYVTYAYGVLRQNETTAALAEAFYIANPDAEKALRDDKTIRLEAEAIFRAIVHFYEKGRLHLKWCDEEDFAVEGRSIARVVPEWGPGVDPHSICALIDGQCIAHCYDADKGLISVLPGDLPVGATHTLEIQARNLNGISARPILRQLEGGLRLHATGDTSIPARVLRVTNHLNNPVDGAVLLLDGKAFAQTGVEGTFLLPDSATENEECFEGRIKIQAPGYFTSTISLDRLRMRQSQSELPGLLMKPLFGGLLQGKTFILDPEHGGEDPGVVTPDCLRASHVNLNVAQRLAAYLRTAGATVTLTRTWDNTMDDEARVRFGLENEVDHFLCIDHLAFRPGENDPPDLDCTWVLQKWDWTNCQCYFDSLLKELVMLLKTPKDEIRRTSTWQSMHAQHNYSVTLVSPMLMTAPRAAERLRCQGCLDKEALGLLHGLARFHLETAKTEGTSVFDLSNEIWGVVVDENGTPINGVCVSLADTLWMQTEPDGEFRFRFLERGAYEVRLEVPALPPRVLTLQAAAEGQIQRIQV